MKLYVIPFLFIMNICVGQGWQAGVMVGVSGYNGDLTQKSISLQTARPSASIILKYNIDNTIVLRGGITWINVEGNDKFNKQANLKSRNLNFKSTIWEASLGTEINLMEPELFFAYPYVFMGLGIIRFNPYTYDKDNKKTYLQPIGTEGQGIPGYPKPYSLTEICLPVGGGWKISLNKKYDIVFEFGYRFLFTDHLDDVSASYVSPQILLEHNGPKSVELSYRHEPTNQDSNLPNSGDIRGNPKKKDGYFVSGIKLMILLSQDRTN